MIDWKRVQELRSEIGEDDFGEVVALFLAEVEEVMARLATPQAAAQICQDLHFLKGSAVNLGFAAFGSLCQVGERAVTGDTPEAANLQDVIASDRESKALFLDGLGT